MPKALQKLEASIEAQQKKLAQLKAKKQAIEARARSLQSKAERAADTRRKILLGAFVMTRLERIDSTVGFESLAVDGGRFIDYLVRDDDRALFGFAALPQPAGSTGDQVQAKSLNETGAP